MYRVRLILPAINRLDEIRPFARSLVRTKKGTRVRAYERTYVNLIVNAGRRQLVKDRSKSVVPPRKESAMVFLSEERKER